MTPELTSAQRLEAAAIIRDAIEALDYAAAVAASGHTGSHESAESPQNSQEAPSNDILEHALKS